MKRKFLSICSIIFVAVLLTGCNVTKSDYQLWRESETAEDLNGDRKINELDYELYLNPPLSPYEQWRNSEDSEDLNGDRKIDEDDYELFLNPPPTAYELWEDSDDAADLNNDNVINEADYELFLNPPPSAYEVWRTSDDAEDLNGDRKIDEDDYELFLNPPPTAYELWAESEDAADLNNDTAITEADYTLYLEFVQFVGTYYIVNYAFQGDAASVLEVSLTPAGLGFQLSQLTISVDIERNVDILVPESTRQLFGANYDIVQAAIDNMTLRRLSDVLIVLDTHVVYESIILHISFYFNKVGSKLTLNYSVYDYTGTILLGNMSFDVIKE